VAATPIAPAVARWLARPRDEAADAGVFGGRLGWMSSIAVTAGLVLLLAGSVMLSAARTYNPFIYFRF